ncbi:Wall-associated receptor kinase, galacturonan-binding domain [Dillenia turbinata]|uniref:non-specific serine/threonine protein kinase n=1 Tax=Dillenia turbinata TaxID=194707 RepID=A0AAN8V9L8_9MAGN
MPLSLHLHLHLLCLSFLFFTATSIAEYACIHSSQMCEDVNISYPFWQIGASDSSALKNICGISVFGLYCPHNGSKPTIELSGETFIVEEINYADYTLTLVDADVTTQDTSCPRARNITLDDTFPLIYSSLDVNLSFYFNCTIDPPPPISLYLAPIECLRSGENMSYVCVLPQCGVEVNDWSRSCEESLPVPVMKGKISYPVNDTFDEAMQIGFVLNWTNMTDCFKCEASGGMCGFNDSTSAREFRCFCNNGKIANPECSSACPRNW